MSGCRSPSAVATFYGQGIERHYQYLLDYQKPELLGDEWTDAEALNPAT